MFAQERQQRVVDLLKRHSRFSVPELEKLFGVSPATIRRDLGFLEESGKILRTHGGALSADHGDGEISFDRKSRQELRAKLGIAEVASNLVKEGDVVFVDAGTTAFKVGVRLLARENITIFTNSVPLLSEPSTSNCRMVAVGGEVRAVSLALVGAESMAWMDRIRFDVAFIGTSGIDPERGACTTELREASVKKAAIRSSRRAVLLADTSKWGQLAPILFADWKDLNDIVTDHSTTRSEQKMLSGYRVGVHRVK
jgi:DeoR/GlpR family transcriptional regulator of sugar metabolism